MKSNFKITALTFLWLVCSFEAAAQRKNDSPLLNQITSLSVNGVEKTIDADSLLKKTVKVEGIDKSVFMAKKKGAVGDFLTSKNAVKKVKGKLRLPLNKGVKAFIDEPSDEETHKEYTYIGALGILNAYVVIGTYWEDLEYLLVSKTDGGEYGFADFPYISGDLKHIISIYDDPDSNQAEFDLYKIVNKKPVGILSVYFKNWIPATEKERMFWGADGSFYVPVLYSGNYPDKKGNHRKDYKYLRISLR